MSEQSESARVDYDKSDHAPKTRTADATVTRIRPNTGSIGQDSNKKALESGNVDNTNVVPEVVLDMARKNKGQ